MNSWKPLGRTDWVEARDDRLVGDVVSLWREVWRVCPGWNEEVVISWRVRLLAFCEMIIPNLLAETRNHSRECSDSTQTKVHVGFRHGGLYVSSLRAPRYA